MIITTLISGGIEYLLSCVESVHMFVILHDFMYCKGWRERESNYAPSCKIETLREEPVPASGAWHGGINCVYVADM